jgi:hypothetical protein
MSDETNKLDAPKCDAREWARKIYAYFLKHLLGDTDSLTAVSTHELMLIEWLEAYALPFIKEVGFEKWRYKLAKDRADKAESERDALRQQLDDAKKLFWPPTNPTDEHIYEIRNGKTEAYIREHVKELIAEAALEVKP